MRIASVYIIPLAFCLFFFSFAPNASAQGGQIRTVQGSYEEVFQNLQDAVIDVGLVIDYVGHVDRMLDRTAAVVDKGTSPYLHARYLQFCSAPLTHKAVSADTNNFTICPLVVFAFETKELPGTISVGFREPAVSHQAAAATFGRRGPGSDPDPQPEQDAAV